MTRPFDDVDQVLSTLRRVEEQSDLFQLKWHNVPFWSACRPVIVSHLLSDFSKVGLAQQKKAVPFSTRLRNIAPNLFLRNPFLKPLRGRFLLSRWERSQVVDGRISEPLSDTIGRCLPGEVIFLDMTGSLRGDRERTWSVEAINLAARAGRLSLADRRSTAPDFRFVEALLREELGVRIDLHSFLEPRVRDIAVRTCVYRRLLSRAQVEEVWAVVFYSNPALVIAAKTLGLPVTDIQHGLLNYAYDGIGYRSDECLPDRLALFGKLWLRSITGHENLKYAVTGAPHIRSRLQSIQKSQRQSVLLVLSQPMIREQLLNFSLDFATLPGAPKVIYRAHPGDDLGACRDAISRASVGRNFELSFGGGSSKTLELQAAARAQLGSFSTAILEGLALGTPTMIFPATGYSMILPFIAHPESRVVSDPAQALALFHDLPELDGGVHALDDLFADVNMDAVSDLCGVRVGGTRT